MDKITEAIAHFVGLFQVTVEEARHRENYREFTPKETPDPDLPALPVIKSEFAAPHELLGFEPDVKHKAPPPEWVKVQPWSFVTFNPPEIPVAGPLDVYPGFLTPMAPVVGSAQQIVLPDAEIIGSIVNLISQVNVLSDDDYFGVGGHDLVFRPEPVGDGTIVALSDAAANLSPIDDLEMPGSAAEIKLLVQTAVDRLEAFPEEPEVAEGTTVAVIKGETLSGTFVNGEEVEEAPKLDDYHSFEEEEEAEAETVHHVQYTMDGLDIEASVSVETGGNTLVNNAVMKNFWTAAPVTAVVGKHLELNAIIQINAWCDSDAISSTIENWQQDLNPVQALNIATFERFDPAAEDDGDAQSDSVDFPKHWVVKEIDGDLMIVNWLQQITCISDNDVGILSSSGVTTSVYSGDNLAVNDAWIEEIGFGYDLIIIGGSVYDANIIHQLNILCDNDLIGAVSNFETTGEGSASTSDNLLWNQAYIYNVGGSNRFEDMPQSYRDAAMALASGDDDLSGILSDPAFAGFGPLRVLYVTGDLLNVQYIKQTNILGDSDQIALAMDALDPNLDADWTLVTGGNALINSASILDLDSIGKTYVGDGHYSGEILIQADIISTDPEYGGQDPNALVNEAIAFLDDDMLGAGQPDNPGVQGHIEYDGSQPDGVQTLLG